MKSRLQRLEIRNFKALSGICLRPRRPPLVVIGAGKIGATVAGLLVSTGDYQVTLADRSPEVLGRVDRDKRIRIAAADVEDSSKLVDLLNGQFAVLNAAPFRLTTLIAEAARAARTHYLDLTEDVASTRRVRELAVDASTAFICARSARDRPPAAERVRSSGRHTVEGFLGEPLRPSLRQAGDGRSVSEFRWLRAMMDASLVQRTSVRDEALAPRAPARSRAAPPGGGAGGLRHSRDRHFAGGGDRPVWSKYQSEASCPHTQSPAVTMYLRKRRGQHAARRRRNWVTARFSSSPIRFARICEFAMDTIETPPPSQMT